MEVFFERIRAQFKAKVYLHGSEEMPGEPLPQLRSIQERHKLLGLRRHPVLQTKRQEPLQLLQHIPGKTARHNFSNLSSNDLDTSIDQRVCFRPNSSSNRTISINRERGIFCCFRFPDRSFSRLTSWRYQKVFQSRNPILPVLLKILLSKVDLVV